MSGGWRPDGEIAEALDIGVATVARVRRRCVEEGLGGGSEPEGAVEPAGEGSGWGGGSSAGGDRLRRSPGGLRAVVVALARGSLGGVRDRGWRESGEGSSYAKKTTLNRG